MSCCTCIRELNASSFSSRNQKIMLNVPLYPASKASRGVFLNLIEKIFHPTVVRVNLVPVTLSFCLQQTSNYLESRQWDCSYLLPRPRLQVGCLGKQQKRLVFVYFCSIVQRTNWFKKDLAGISRIFFPL